MLASSGGCACVFVRASVVSGCALGVSWVCLGCVLGVSVSWMCLGCVCVSAVSWVSLGCLCQICEWTSLGFCCCSFDRTRALDLTPHCFDFVGSLHRRVGPFRPKPDEFLGLPSLYVVSAGYAVAEKSVIHYLDPHLLELPRLTTVRSLLI